MAKRFKSCGQNSASGVDVGAVADFLFVANLVVVDGPFPISGGSVEGPFKLSAAVLF